MRAGKKHQMEREPGSEYAVENPTSHWQAPGTMVQHDESLASPANSQLNFADLPQHMMGALNFRG